MLNDSNLRIFHFQDFYLVSIYIATGRKHISLWTPGLSNFFHNLSDEVLTLVFTTSSQLKVWAVTLKFFMV